MCCMMNIFFQNLHVIHYFSFQNHPISHKIFGKELHKEKKTNKKNEEPGIEGSIFQEAERNQCFTHTRKRELFAQESCKKAKLRGGNTIYSEIFFKTAINSN